MFSISELNLIKECMQELKENLQRHIQSPVFSSQEKKQKVQEIGTMTEIIKKADEAGNIYVPLDADMLGELCVFWKHLKAYITQMAKDGDIGAEDYGEKLYRLGFLQAKLEVGLLTQDEYADIVTAQKAME